jgi:5-methylcytosine-specific restriction protein A
VTLKDLTRRAVLAAMGECDQVGRDTFLAEHGFHPGEYLVIHEGRPYDSKAIAGVAHGYATGDPLPARKFSGGAATVQPALEKLGFQVNNGRLDGRGRQRPGPGAVLPGVHRTGPRAR